MDTSTKAPPQCPSKSKAPRSRWIAFFEIVGSVTAMAYALLIASNTGNEVLGFSLLFISAALFAGWGVLDRRWAFFALQFFYMASAVIGVWRWM